MITCPTCSKRTPEALNFCKHCKHKVRDLLDIKLGKGTRNVRSIERFWETGNPAVFAQPGAPDYDPRLAA